MAGTGTGTRPRKSAAEKAQVALDVATKRLEKAQEKLNTLSSQIDDAETEVARAERFRAFAKSNPDLPVAKIA